jgi:hypothetical protein
MADPSTARSETGGDAARSSQLFRAGLLALLLLPLAFVVLRCAVSNAIPFIAQSSDAPWITRAEKVSGLLRQWNRLDFPVTVFRHGFELASVPPAATLRVRALRSFRVLVNGVAVPGAAGDGSDWRSPLEIDVAPWLRPGANELSVEVKNPVGPALLSLRLEGIEPPLRSDPSWRVAVDGREGLARIADDTLRSIRATEVETPAEALRRRWVAVLLLFAAGSGAALAVRTEPVSRVASRLAPHLPAATLVLGLLAWAAVFVRKLVYLPLSSGFDAQSHIRYIDFVITHHAVPLATEGWSTFHPPLFYALAAAAFEASQALGATLKTGQIAIKAVAFAAGMGTLAVTAALARRLLPDDPVRQALAVLFATVLPVNLYSAAYVSNESLHTLFASLALLATVDVLLAARPSRKQLLLLGVCFGLAAVTKFTVLALIPVALGFVAFKLRLGVREPAQRRLALIEVCLPIALIAGWFYVRNWLEFGDPLIANWGARVPRPGFTWWQYPGFRTLAYFTGFGEALVHPYMAGFRSFWDSAYSTFWGDGFIAGHVYPPDRHRLWNYDFMSAGYLLALPATVMLLAGAALGVRTALRDPNPGRRLSFAMLAGVAWVLCLAFVYLSLSLAIFSQAKATYVLALLGPLSLWFALGFRALERRLAAIPLARAALCGWLAAFAGVLYLGFAG